jgi:WhiB family transcriptional regulator, redox-sensing transcriptional regulator
MTWRNRASCLDESPELFFPIGNASPAHLQIEKAKAVCRRCGVAEACLRWAIEFRQDTGVWGGLSDDERHALKRHNARARRAS